MPKSIPCLLLKSAHPKCQQRAQTLLRFIHTAQSILRIFLFGVNHTSPSSERLSEKSVLGVARLQTPCPALPSIAVSHWIRLLRAPGAGRFHSGFGLRVIFQTISKIKNAKAPSLHTELDAFDRPLPVGKECYEDA